jgi:hypothetical protein
MEEMKEDKRPLVVYAKPHKSQLEREKQTDLASLIPLLVEAVDARVSQRLQMLQRPKKRRIFKVLTDEDGKKLTEETVVEIE